jgi:hypothetical protein
MKFTLTQTAQIYISKWGHVNQTSWIFLGHIVVILGTLMTYCMIVLLVFNNLSDSLTSVNKNVCMWKEKKIWQLPYLDMKKNKCENGPTMWMLMFCKNGDLTAILHSEQSPKASCDKKLISSITRNCQWPQYKIP